MKSRRYFCDGNDPCLQGTPTPAAASWTTSYREMASGAPVGGGGTEGGSNGSLFTDGDGGLADWASVVIGLLSLFVAIFSVWRKCRQQDRPVPP